MSLRSWINDHFDVRDHGRSVGGVVKAVVIAGMLSLTACVGLAKYARAHEASDLVPPVVARGGQA